MQIEQLEIEYQKKMSKGIANLLGKKMKKLKLGVQLTEESSSPFKINKASKASSMLSMNSQGN
jgi:hypothetical protein